MTPLQRTAIICCAIEGGIGGLLAAPLTHWLVPIVHSEGTAHAIAYSVAGSSRPADTKSEPQPKVFVTTLTACAVPADSTEEQS